MILQPRALAHNLIAVGHLPAQSLRRLVGNPHLQKETDGIELRKHPCVNRVGPDLGVGDDSNLLRVDNQYSLYMRAR